MGIVKNTKNVSKGIGQMAKGYTPFLGYAHNLRTKGNTYDELKNAIGDLKTPHSVFIKNYYDIDVDCKSALSDSIIYEYNPFFHQNIRTSVLLNKIETMSANIMNGWRIVDDDDESSAVRFNNLNQNVIFDDRFVNDFIVNYITKDRFLVRLNVTDDDIIFETIDTDRYFIDEGVLHVVTHVSENEYIVEKEINNELETLSVKRDLNGKFFENTVNVLKKTVFFNNFYFEVESNYNVVTDGALELTLLFSEMFTSIQKESKISPTNLTVDKRLAPNGVLNFYKNAIIEIKKPESLNVDAPDNSEIKYDQMSIRANDFQTLGDYISTQIDNIILADQTPLGLDPTATAVAFSSSEVAKKVNRIKGHLASVFTDLLTHFFSTAEYRVEIDDYIIDNREIQDKLDADAIKNGLNTRKNILRQRNEGWSDDELMLNYLTIELKMGNELNEFEREEAVKIGLIKPDISEGLTLIPLENEVNNVDNADINDDIEESGV